MNKIPIGIKSCHKNDFRQSAVRDTWFKDIDREKFYPFFILGNSLKIELSEDILHLDCSDAYYLLYTKTISYFDWVYNNTNSSHFWIVDDDSYLNAKIFNNYNKYLNYDYCGNFIYGINKRNDRSGYTSGCGYCLSRSATSCFLENVKSMIEFTKQQRKNFYEDMLVGDTLNKFMFNVKKLHIPSIYPWSFCTYKPYLMIGHYIHKGQTASDNFGNSMKKMHSLYKN